MNRLATLCAVALAALGLTFAVPGAARADGGDNTAIAINTKDGSTVFKLAFKIARASGDVVDNSNAAVAFASCTDCQTVAIAIEVVLILDNPNVITPTNLALAYNYECTDCETLASAFQYVLSTGGPVHFTAEGNREIAQIRYELEQLRKCDTCSIEEIEAKAEELFARLEEVIKTQLVPAGNSGKTPSGGTSTSPQPPSTQPTTTQPPPPPPAATTTNETTTEPTTTGTTTTTPTTP
jgi:putative peptide zinc metalloprotease protein